jgi:hypothetical protein
MKMDRTLITKIFNTAYQLVYIFFDFGTIINYMCVPKSTYKIVINHPIYIKLYKKML